MNSDMLEDILACPTLPSLPSIAMRVIELASNPNVKIPELASTIQNDQGLTAKVLRTVNSSFYGLREKCGTINKALVLLGLSPVKGIVLGFSLVSSVGQRQDGFDYQSYWRRGLLTAVGGKLIVEAAGKKYGDEVFIAGMLQDIGVMAMYRALGDEYLAVMSQTGGDHRKLCKAEISSLEMQHPDIGAMLAERWKLPRSLVVPVKYHERPTAAPQEHLEITQAVGLGNLIHDALTVEDAVEARRKLYDRASQWLGLSSDQVDAVLRRVGQASKELAGLFRVDIGPMSSADAILTRAETRLVHAAPDECLERSQGLELVLVDPTDVDPRTGLMGRKGFDFALRRAWKLMSEDREIAGLTNIVIEASPGADPEYVSQTAVALLKKQFGPMGAAICRLSGWLFAVITIGPTQPALAAAAEEFRLSLNRAPASEYRLAASVGIVTLTPEQALAFGGPESLVRASAEAIQACKSSGGNCVRSHPHRLAA
ncbi:MAG: HDOD domain-containing protein [Phycisphaeraceae bacterium]|nr:MAG: HDOD domain-containing protein [Phycisphaeraceae bacterium]